MEWLNLLKNKVVSVWEDRKVNKKEKWSIAIEKDLMQMSSLLSTQLKNKVSYNKQANELLADNIEYLKIARFYYPDEQSQMIAKDLLLKLWDNLLKTMDLIATGSIYNYYKALIFLIRRNEFGPNCIKTNINTNKLEISQNDEKFSQEYRKMLFQTQEWVQEKISPEEIIDPLTKSVKRVKRTPTYLFSSFVANVLAINSFHIPEMLDSFIKIIAAETSDANDYLGEWLSQVTPNEWKGDFSSSFEIKSKESYIDAFISKELKESIDDFDKELTLEFPSLFQWRLFHKMIAKKNDNLYERFSQNQQNWCDVIDIESGIYFLFLKAWIEHVQFVVEETGKKKIDWKRIVGYKTFVRGFLYGMKKLKSLNRMVLDCSVTLLTCEPILIDFFVKVSFTTTNVHDLTTLLDSLSNLETWFRSMKKNQQIIPNSFDHTFFCKGLDIIFEHEHHIPISKVLNLLFNFAELFGDESRRAVYGNLLIQKYFFKFFLHWDVVIRSTFHQLIVFKCLRNKRKDIRGVQSKSEYFRNPQFEVDTVLFSKIESHVRMVKEHMKDKGHSAFIHKSLEGYIPKALQEYKGFTERYQIWENTNSPVPNLVSYQQKEYKV